jgi:hypothetical protein
MPTARTAVLHRLTRCRAGHGESGTIDITGRILTRAALPETLAALVPRVFVAPGARAEVGIEARTYAAGATVANFVVRHVPAEARSFVVDIVCITSLTPDANGRRHNAVSGSPVVDVALL